MGRAGIIFSRGRTWRARIELEPSTARGLDLEYISEWVYITIKQR